MMFAEKLEMNYTLSVVGYCCEHCGWEGINLCEHQKNKPFHVHYIQIEVALK